jgi:hypothetical protein
MARITVRADDGRLVHREWVVGLQVESDHFLGCLAERLRWAIADAELAPAVGTPAVAHASAEELIAATNGVEGHRARMPELVV